MNKQIKMKIQIGKMTDFKNRGKWKDSEMKHFLSEQFKIFSEKKITETQILSVSVNEFYQKFYSGNKQIKYKSYYCRKHVLDNLSELKIDGNCMTESENLLIKFC